MFRIKTIVSQVIDETDVMDHKYGFPSSTRTEDNPIWLDDDPYPLGTTQEEGMEVVNRVDQPMDVSVLPPNA